MWNDSANDATVILSICTNLRVDLHSVPGLSLLSVDTLDNLLSSDSFIVDSEDALLRSLLEFHHPALLRHIR